MSLSLIEQVRRAGVPSVFSVHDDWLVYGWEADAWTRIWRGRRRVLAQPAELVFGVPTRVDVAAAGKMLFNSDYTRSRAVEAGIDAPGALVIRPGIHRRFLEPVRPTPCAWQVLYIGRVDRQKGIDTAVEALAELPETASLTVCGSGDPAYITEMHLRAAALGLGERLRFLPFAAGDEVRAIYAASDVVVFPVRWEEPWGLVPLEAMALGRPLVSTARGGSVEFLRDGENALTFPADDHLALARCIERLAEDEELRERLRQGGKQTAARYTADEFDRRTVEEVVDAGVREAADRS
jgi:glycosyltransferase involved in cell wall biosynthesis